jgi:rSAM/selenodomain-associated transferase 1
MRRLAVFARPPIEGQVKTRLSPALSPALARALYEGMLSDTLVTAAGAAADERIVFWADAAPVAPRPARPAGMLERQQAGGDLGGRLAEAFSALLEGPGARGIVIGTDCPDLDAALIDEAFGALERADVVIGPASDGGYYLIGLARPAPGLFAGIDWSTERVLDQTMAAAAAESLSVARVRVLDDIDTPADLARWIGRQVAGGHASAPATREALARMGLLPA